jgi:uncharacterized phage protein gp47/JayE
MSLRIKSIREILNGMVIDVSTRTNKITDFTEGSATRTLLEAVALQLEEFYFNMRQNIEYAIENAIYDAFGFSRIPEEKATGYVTIHYIEAMPAEMIIPINTIFTTSMAYNKVIKFRTTADVVVEKGVISVKVPVECLEAGEIGNVDPGKICIMTQLNSLVDYVENEEKFVNGVTAETSQHQKNRFREYIKSLARATAPSIAYGTKEVEGVAGVWVDDNYVGFVRVYAHDKNGDLPDELRQAIYDNLEEYRAAGVEVEVIPIVKVPADVSIFFVFTDETDVNEYLINLKQLITDFLNNYEVSNNLYITDLTGAITLNYKDVIVTFEVESGYDKEVLPYEMICAGNIEVTGTNLKNWKK